MVAKLSKSDANRMEGAQEDDESLTEKVEDLSQKLQDSEQSVKVLRRIKNAYKQALEIKCRGCSKSFKPVIFKAHIMSCQHLLENSESFQEIAQSSDIDQVFIKALTFNH